MFLQKLWNFCILTQFLSETHVGYFQPSMGLLKKLILCFLTF